MTTAALDSTHPLWATATAYGIDAGLARFACKGRAVGTMVLVTHNGRRPKWIIELGVDLSVRNLPGNMVDEIADWLAVRTEAGPTWSIGGVDFHAHRSH